jgi:hypothetical protein
VQQVINFSKRLSLPIPLANSMAELYCALHPEKWDEPVSGESRKKLLKDIATKLLLQTLSEETEKCIEQLKKLQK